MCQPFSDGESDGLLFMDAPALALRIEPFAPQGWCIATHAIGDRGIVTVLDAYELARRGDLSAIAAAARVGAQCRGHQCGGASVRWVDRILDDRFPLLG